MTQTLTRIRQTRRLRRRRQNCRAISDCRLVPVEASTHPNARDAGTPKSGIETSDLFKANRPLRTRPATVRLGELCSRRQTHRRARGSTRQTAGCPYQLWAGKGCPQRFAKRRKETLTWSDRIDERLDCDAQVVAEERRGFRGRRCWRSQTNTRGLFGR
jgi:hypothetical protein